MDLLTVAIVLSLMAVGGGLVYWPMSLYVKALEEDLCESAKRNLALAAGVKVERALDDARDESPDAELRLLLDTPGLLGEPSTNGAKPPGGRVEDTDGQGRGGNAPLRGPA